MKDVLEQIYGSSLKCFSEGKYSLPLYLLDGRKLYDVSIADRSFVIVYLSSLERFHVKTLKKQLAIYQSSVNNFIVYGFNKLSTFQRRSLIENGIPFVSCNGQMYIPFLGIYFDRCSKGEDNQNDRFMPVTQLLFLLFLYDNKAYTKSEAAERLGIKPMSVTRASRQLIEKNLIQEMKDGKEVLMTADYSDRYDYYESGKPFLINPVQSQIYLPNGRVDRNTPAAGEFGLSLRSDLGYPEYVEYAFYKDTPGIKESAGLDPDLNEADNLVRIQKWKYDPLLFSVEAKLDPVSLICTLDATNDERVHKCLEQVREEIGKWQIT